MQLTPDQLIKNFEGIMKTQLDNPSEADTRSKLIDPILKECLNWEDENIFREEHANPGLVDYVIRIKKKTVLVIEAKKEGYSFKLPMGFGFVRDYTLGGVLKKEKTIAPVIAQARRYCHDKGARYGAITNGDQFIVFEAEKPGADWEEGNCKVFYNFDDIHRHFTDFLNILSKNAVGSGGLANELSRGSEALNFIKPVDDVYFKNEIEPRNELYRYMISIINHTFKEITDLNDIEMLQECYVIENEFQQVSESLRSHFGKDLRDSDVKIVKQGEEHAGAFHWDFYDKMELLKKMPTRPTICLLLGRIGSGKTTFVFRFFNIVLIEEERKKVKWFYIDFKNAPTDPKSIRKYILDGIITEFATKYCELLRQYLEKLKIKVDNTAENLTNLFLLLRSEGYTPALVVDNVDQHILQSPTYHESVFLEANSLMKELGTITIMTLREESFYSSSTGGVFNAYYIEQYRVMPPDFRKLLIFRLDYILRKLQLPNEKVQEWLGEYSLNFEPKVQEIVEFLTIIKTTLQERATSSLARFVSKTSGGNMRRALELFANFLTSGNTKIREILETKEREGSYIIAEHQFIRSIVLGSYTYYSKNSSYLMNIFDVDIDLCQSHFVKLKILSYAETQIPVNSPHGGGFVSINRIALEANDISISREAIEAALLQLAKYGLIILNTRSITDLSGASHFKITDCGAYFLHLLMMRFSYIDLVLADTPISDVDTALEIRRMLPKRELNERFERTQLFIEYLIRMEKRDFETFPEYQFSPLGQFKYTTKIMHNFQTEKAYILERQRRKTFRLLDSS